MTVHYCDRCKKAVRNLAVHKIPDWNKTHCATSYALKEVELCDKCFDFVLKCEDAFLCSLIDTKFAFYKAIMAGSEDNNAEKN